MQESKKKKQRISVETHFVLPVVSNVKNVKWFFLDWIFGPCRCDLLAADLQRLRVLAPTFEEQFQSFHESKNSSKKSLAVSQNHTSTSILPKKGF